MKKTLGLLYGGKSAEHEVSLSTAFAVLKAIDFQQYEVLPIYITLQGEWRTGELLNSPIEKKELLRFQRDEEKPHSVEEFLHADQAIPQIILPLLHGTNGEDGTVQGFLETLNIPYIGNGVLASAAAMDKVMMKQLFEHVGLKQVRYCYFVRSQWQKQRPQMIEEIERKLQWPVFVKPANLGSSVGISRAINREELIRAVELALKFDRKIVVEQGIEAREIEVGVIGNEQVSCSVLGEIQPVAEFYDYEAKYEDNQTQLLIPAPVSSAVEATIQDMAKRAFTVLDCAGLVRADFFVTADDEVYINEVNTMPGFTPTSMFPMLWQHAGVPYPALIQQLIDLAWQRYEEKQLVQYTMD